MRFFHGSRDENLKKLVTSHSGGKIYLTDRYEFAFLYAACSLRLWGWDEKNDRPIFRESCKDCFKLQFDKARCYIYACETDDAELLASHPSKTHVFISHKDLPVTKIEVIEDAYQKLMQLEKDGRVTLIRWEDYSEEEQKMVQERLYADFHPMIEIEREKYPEEYKLLITICPKLALEDK